MKSPSQAGNWTAAAGVRVRNPNRYPATYSKSTKFNGYQWPTLFLHLYLLKFVKELVILFHQISAAPRGHVASTIKRAHTEDSSSFFHSHRC